MPPDDLQTDVPETARHARADPIDPHLAELPAIAVDQSPDAIIVAGLDGRVRLWNAGAEAIFGYTADEVVGRTLDIIIPDHLRRAHWTGFHRALAQGWTKYERSPLTTLAHHKTERPLYIDLTFSIVKDPRGEPIGAMAVARDVTSRYLVERGLREGVLEMAFLTADAEWRVTFQNDLATRTLEAGDLRGRALWDAMPSLIGTPLYERLFQAAADQQSAHLEGFYPPLGGWVEVHAYPSPAGMALYVRSVNRRKRLEEELRETEARFRLLVQVATDYAITLYDPSGAVTSWNAGAERMFGYRSDEIIGRPFSTFFPPEDTASGRPARILQTVRATGRYAEEGWRVRKDGTRFWADIVLSPIADGDGELRGVGAVTRDRTDRKRIEDELRRTTARVRRLVESNIVGVVIGDMSGRIHDANDAFLRLLGLTRAQLEAGELDQARVLAPESLDAYRDAVEQLRARGIARLHEREYLRAGGGRVWALVGMARIDETGDEFISFVLDISERKQVELERARLLEAAEEAVRARDEFLSIASHELRTPLGSLSLQLQAMERSLRRQLASDRTGADGQESIRQAELRMVQSSERQARTLAALLDELLDVTRIRLGRMQLNPREVDLSLVVREALSRFAPTAAKAGSQMTADIERPVVGNWDPLRIEQVVNNLVSNAIKYGEGRPIELAVAEREGVALFTVRDHGMGIAPEMQARVFDRFERAYTGRKIAGLGLGLFIVRQIVQAHGGTIRLESALHQGSTFTVELPLGR